MHRSLLRRIGDQKEEDVEDEEVVVLDMLEIGFSTILQEMAENTGVLQAHMHDLESKIRRLSRRSSRRNSHLSPRTRQKVEEAGAEATSSRATLTSPRKLQLELARHILPGMANEEQKGNDSAESTNSAAHGSLKNLPSSSRSSSLVTTNHAEALAMLNRPQTQSIASDTSEDASPSEPTHIQQLQARRQTVAAGTVDMLRAKFADAKGLIGHDTDESDDESDDDSSGNSLRSLEALEDIIENDSESVSD